MSLKSVFKYRHRGDQHELGNWYIGWHSWKPEILYKLHGYEEDNAQLHISLFGWHSIFILPWTHKEHNYYGESKEYGFSIHDSTLFWYWGLNCKGWGIPFFDYGSSIRWDVYSGPKELHPKQWTKEDWSTKEDYTYSNATHFEYDFTDPYDGTVVKADFIVMEQEWRPKWFKWTSWRNIVNRRIDVNFSEEVGARKGSWKGGVIGGTYNMNPNEAPYECIKRMEKDYGYFDCSCLNQNRQALEAENSEYDYGHNVNSTNND